MILILFGIWVITYILILYFCWGTQIECDQEDAKKDCEKKEKKENSDSEYIGESEESEEIENEEAENPEDSVISKLSVSGNVRTSNPKFYHDVVTNRVFSRKWINSQLPYTKGNHFWLISREDLTSGSKRKNSIEVVRNLNRKTLTIRYWDNNRIDGPELIFSCNDKTLIVSLFNKGTMKEIETETEKIDLISYAESLFNFYSSSSPYIKNLNIESYFTH